MPSTPRPLGSSGLSVAPISYGAMMLTWTGASQPPPEEQAFESLNAGIDGAEGKVLVNTGTFYTNTDKPDNLLLLARYFKKYPEKRDKVVISVKGGMAGKVKLGPLSSSIEELRDELKFIADALGSVPDLFEPARRNTKVSNQQYGEWLKTLRDEGLFHHVGLSEVNATTIREINAIVPVAAVEVEYNPFSLEIEEQGVLAACKELGIAIVAYSPLSRGFFGGKLRSRADLDPKDMRLHFPRFSEENFDKNVKLVDEFTAIAQKLGITAPQLVLAWELAQYDRMVLIPGSSRVENVRGNRAAEKVELDAQTLQQLRAIVDDVQKRTAGTRYPEMGMGMTLQ